MGNDNFIYFISLTFSAAGLESDWRNFCGNIQGTARTVSFQLTNQIAGFLQTPELMDLWIIRP